MKKLILIATFILNACGGYKEEEVIEVLNKFSKHFECRKQELATIERYAKALPETLKSRDERYAYIAINLNEGIAKYCSKAVLKAYFNLKLAILEMTSMDRETGAHTYRYYSLSGPLTSMGVTLKKTEITGGFAGREGYGSYDLEIKRDEFIKALTLLKNKIYP